MAEGDCNINLMELKSSVDVLFDLLNGFLYGAASSAASIRTGSSFRLPKSVIC